MMCNWRGTMSPQRLTRGIALASAAVLLFPAFSQTQSTGTGTTTSSTTGTTSTGTTTTGSGSTKGGIPTTTSPTTSTTPSTNTQPAYQRPMLITGRVMVDDGT